MHQHQDQIPHVKCLSIMFSVTLLQHLTSCQERVVLFKYSHKLFFLATVIKLNNLLETLEMLVDRDVLPACTSTLKFLYNSPLPLQ